MRKKDNARIKALKAKGHKSAELVKGKILALWALPFAIPAVALGVLLAALAFTGLAISGDDESPAATPSPTVSAVSDEFTITLPKREMNRLNSDGVDPKNRGNAEAFRKQIAEQAKHDPLTLYVYYQASPLGTIKPLTNETVLAKDGKIENGNVYSKKGRQVYKEWLAMWDSPLTGVKAVDEIKFQGLNTGVEGTTVTQSPGVNGADKSGYDVTYKDAMSKVVRQHSALNRCTQPTSDIFIIRIRIGRTDNPHPRPPGEFKDWSKNVSKPQGVTRLGPGRLTDGHESSDQKEDGQTSGNVIDHKVPSGTKSGDTTSDTGDSVKAPGAHEGGDDSDDAVSDDSVTTDDDGGTDGATEISEPSDE